MFQSESSTKLYGKVYFYVKKSKSETNNESAGSSKYEEIRKIVLPSHYQEFYNQIMLSLAKDSGVKQHLSDSAIPLKLSKANGIIFKFLGSDNNWTTFSSQEEYDQALNLCKVSQNHCLRIRVYYKKSLFKSSKSSKKVSENSNTCVHNLTVCSDFSELQRLLREHSNNPTTSSSTTSSPNNNSNNDQFFNFWSSGSSCLESKA